MSTGRMLFLLLFFLRSNILKFQDERSAFLSGQYNTMTRESFCSQGMSPVLCQIIPTQIYMEKYLNNGGFDNYGGGLNLREFYRFQPIVNKGIVKLHGYTFAKEFYLQPSDVKNYRDILIFFCFNFHWTCMFILLIYFKVFGKVQWTTLQYKRYRGHIWSRRKVY